MAGGWARDGAVSEQIEASISDELARMKGRRAPVGESLTHCAECEEPIPEARRAAMPGSNCAWTAWPSGTPPFSGAAGSIGAGQRTAS